MPDIADLLKKTKEKKKFKKSNYRPWNFMEQIGREEEKKTCTAIPTGGPDFTEKSVTEEKEQPLQLAIKKVQNSANRPTKEDCSSLSLQKLPSIESRESAVDKIFRLFGHQKILFNFIVELCLSRGLLTTGAINNSSLAELLNTSSKMVKTTIYRLVQKELIIREKGKRGRGGFYSFSINEPIRAAALEYKRLLVGPERKISNGHHMGINKEAVPLQSNNSYVDLRSEEWRTIDIEPLASIGFSEVHLSQIVSQNKLSVQIIQDSICSFAFDLQENNKAKKIKGDPINFFMGILRNGKPYAPPSNYESPQDKAMRVYQEKMRKIEKGREAIEKESKDLAYKDWFSKLTDDQKIQFLPENLRRNAKVEKNKFLEGGARVHFETEIWPNKKKEIIQEEKTIKKWEEKEEEK